MQRHEAAKQAMLPMPLTCPSSVASARRRWASGFELPRAQSAMPPSSVPKSTSSFVLCCTEEQDDQAEIRPGPGSGNHEVHSGPAEVGFMSFFTSTLRWSDLMPVLTPVLAEVSEPSLS